jgi:hypothetical protein
MRLNYLSSVFIIAALAVAASRKERSSKRPTPVRVLERTPGPRFHPIPRRQFPVSDRATPCQAQGIVLEPPVQTAPPQITATTALGLATGCDPLHYLLDRAGTNDQVGIDNRFSWWDKSPPEPGPLRPPSGIAGGAVRDSLICQFHPALARIVGTSDSRVIRAGFKLLSWDSEAIGSPAALQEIEFIVRAQYPQSVPQLRELTDGRGNPVRVLVNDSAPGYELDLSGERLRPSLWLDFAVPQRAVAIEYGAPADAEQGIQQAGVKLIGYDRQGRVLRVGAGRSAAELRADGRPYNGRVLAVGDFGNVVGIQDRDGRISRVELRFDYRNAQNLEEGGDPGPKIRAQQVVRRIWHEPLPPAAVRQGSVGITTFQLPANWPSNLPTPQTFEQLVHKASGPETIALPFRFDRAVVMIRGVRWQFAVPMPRPITELSAEIGPFGVAEFPLDEQPDASLSPRLLTLTPGGRIVAETCCANAFHVIVDYTLLGWSSEQVELHGTQGFSHSARAQDNWAISQMIVNDPCPFSNISLSVEQRRERCGPLFGAPQGFTMTMSVPQEPDWLALFTGSEHGTQNPNNNLFRDDRNGQPVAVWGQGMWLTSGDNRHHLEFLGTVLTGPSLRVGPDRLVAEGRPEPESVRNADEAPNRDAQRFYPAAMTGPRDDRNVYVVSADVYRQFGIAWPMIADVGFLALELIEAWPSGPLQQLDFEAKGESYQGSIVDWKTGLGINTEWPGASSGRERQVAATALFGAVRRMAPFRTGIAAKRDLVFEDGVQGLTQRAAHIPGMLENTGRDALWIDDLRKGTTPADRYFEYLFQLSRQPMESGGTPAPGLVVLNEQQFRERMPLMLRPGERIEILGRYTPDVPTGTLPHMGSMEFRVRSGVTNNIQVFAIGTATAAAPGGEWRPDSLVFPALTLRGEPPQSQVAMLRTTGRTPLALRRLYLEDETLGYRFEVLTQVEPDLLPVRVTCGTTAASCRGRTRLVAETNAGTIPIVVRIEAPLRTNPPGDSQH